MKSISLITKKLNEIFKLTIIGHIIKYWRLEDSKHLWKGLIKKYNSSKKKKTYEVKYIEFVKKINKY